jgi:A/G-specific adenine glycosylase
LNIKPEPLPDARWRAGFRRRLGAWYARHARDLPWRRHRAPYPIWLSEIMLQQTTVAAVGPYFERFLETFPTIGHLAKADRDRVLRLWEGLGYYRRAAQMHEAARQIVDQHGGSFPRDPDAVRRLPGIGRYTAGAILSIAFDLRQPILEANTARLFSRLLAFRGSPASRVGQDLLWAMAEAVLPRRQVGRFNQALMELGSQVCAPRTPRCEECPVALLCRARAQGLVARIPPPKQKADIEQVREAAVIVRRKGRVLLAQRPEGARWAGLWDFPRFPLTATESDPQRRELRAALRQLTGIDARLNRLLTTLRHSVTRFRITLDCYDAIYQRDGGGATVPTRWLRPDELADYPLSTTGRKLAKMAVKGVVADERRPDGTA